MLRSMLLPEKIETAVDQLLHLLGSFCRDMPPSCNSALLLVMSGGRRRRWSALGVGSEDFILDL